MSRTADETERGAQNEKEETHSKEEAEEEAESHDGTA